jgi:hypothetical protein
MIAITLVFSTMFFILSLVVGGLVGWVYRGHVMWTQPSLHPEMFDSNGNVIPDEIIAFRFEEEEEETED